MFHLVRAARALLIPSIAAGVLLTPPAAHAGRPTGGLGALQHTPVMTSVEDVAKGGCPEVVTYTSRGAGENFDFDSPDWPGRTKYYGGVGEEMSVVANSIAEQLYPGTTPSGVARVKTLANVAPKIEDLNGKGFPATLEISTDVITATVDSVRRGTLAMIADVNQIRAACPQSRLVFIGYSAGAAVLRTALAATAQQPAGGAWIKDPPAPGQSIALVFGDTAWSTRPEYRTGTRYIGDTFIPGALGTKDEEGLSSWIFHHGSFSAEQRPWMYPAQTPDRYDLVSFCNGTDPACQAVHQLGGAIGLNGHLTYDTRWAIAAGNLVAGEFAPGIRAAVAAPFVRIPEGLACLGSRGAATTVTISGAASAAGSAPASASAAWQVSGIGFTGSPAAGRSLTTPVRAGAEAGLGLRLSLSPFSNDLLAVTSPTSLSSLGKVSLYEGRLCPLA